MATKAAATTKKAPAKSASAKTTTKKKTVTSAPASASSNALAGHVKSSLRSVALWRSLGAEFIGTFLLAAVIIAGQGQLIFVLFALVGVILLVGSISGAHVNPAMTFGALVTRRIGWLRAVGYIAAQLLGAALAFVVLSAFIAGAAVSEEAELFGQTAPVLFSAVDVATLVGKEWYVFFAEVLGASILGFAIAYATRAKDALTAAFAGGLGIFVALMVAVSAANYVGGSAILNPAVAISLQAYNLDTIWPFVVYAVAPILGGIVGFIVHDLLRVRTA